MFDQIEQLKREYTDKYVMVDGGRPELARFRDIVGRVKTVNMSGRALVEFDDYHLNIGWYDIDPTFLKVVDKPPPKPKEAPAAKKPAAEPAAKKPAGEAAAGEKKLSPLEMARAQGAAGKAGAAPAAKPAAGKPSTADILAAARGGAAAKPAGETASAAAKPAATPNPAGAAPAKVDRSKMSVADMMAAARAQGAAGSAPAAPAAKAAAPAPAKAAPPVAAEPAEVPAATPAAKKSSGEKVDRKSMSVAQIIAWCREHDAK